MVPSPHVLMGTIDGDAEFASIMAHASTFLNVNEKDNYLQQQLSDAYQKINEIQALVPTPPQPLTSNLQLEVESQNMLMEGHAYEMDCTRCGRATPPEDCLKTLDLMTQTFKRYRAAVANQIHHERQRADFHRARAARLRQERNSANANLSQLAKFEGLIENGGAPVNQHQAAALLAAFSQARIDLDQIQQGIVITNDPTLAPGYDDEADLRADQVVHPDGFPGYAGVTGLVMDFQTTVDSLNARIRSLAEQSNPPINIKYVSRGENEISNQATTDKLAEAEQKEEIAKVQLHQENTAKNQAILHLAVAESRIAILQEQLKHSQQVCNVTGGAPLITSNDDRLTIEETVLAEQVIITAISAGDNLLDFINNLPQPLEQRPQDFAGLRQRLAQCHTANLSLQTQLATRTENSTHQARNALRDPVRRLLDENSAAATRIENLQDQLAATIGDLNNSTADNQALRDHLEFSNGFPSPVAVQAHMDNSSRSSDARALKTLQNKVAQMDRDLKDAERDLARAEGARKKFKNAHEAAQNNAVELQKRLDESTEYMRLEKSRLHSKDAKLTSLQNRLDNNQIDIDHLNVQLTKLTESNQTLRNDLAAPHAIRSQPLGSKVTIVQLQRANANLSKTAERWEHNLQALQNQSNTTVADLRATLVEVTAERNDVREQLRAQREINHTQLADLPGYIEELEVLVKKLTAERDTLCIQVDDYSKSENDCMNENARLHDNIVALTTERNTAQIERDYARAQIGNSTPRDDDVIASLNRNISTLTTERDHARQQYRNLVRLDDAGNSAHDAVVQRLNERIVILTAERDTALQISPSNSALAKLRKEVKKLTAARDTSIVAEQDCTDEKDKMRQEIAKLKVEKDAAVAQPSPVTLNAHNGNDTPMPDPIDELPQQGDDGGWGGDDQFDPPPDEIENNEDEPVDHTDTINRLETMIKNLGKREYLMKKANRNMAKSLLELQNPTSRVPLGAAVVSAEFAHQELIATLQNRIAELEAQIAEYNNESWTVKRKRQAKIAGQKGARTRKLKRQINMGPGRHNQVPEAVRNAINDWQVEGYNNDFIATVQEEDLIARRTRASARLSISIHSDSLHETDTNGNDDLIHNARLLGKTNSQSLNPNDGFVQSKSEESTNKNYGPKLIYQDRERVLYVAYGIIEYRDPFEDEDVFYAESGLQVQFTDSGAVLDEDIAVQNAKNFENQEDAIPLPLSVIGAENYPMIISSDSSAAEDSDDSDDSVD